MFGQSVSKINKMSGDGLYVVSEVRLHQMVFGNFETYNNYKQNPNTVQNKIVSFPENVSC